MVFRVEILIQLLLRTFENITILKDASTTAIYGSAAANGVVLITTKSGKRGDLKIEYDGSAGFADVTRRLDMLNASEYVDLVTDIQHSNGLEITAKLASADVRVDRYRLAGRYIPESFYH